MKLTRPEFSIRGGGMSMTFLLEGGTERVRNVSRNEMSVPCHSLLYNSFRLISPKRNRKAVNHGR